jgi:hypothetical protein
MIAQNITFVPLLSAIKPRRKAKDRLIIVPIIRPVVLRHLGIQEFTIPDPVFHHIYQKPFGLTESFHGRNQIQYGPLPQ